MKKKIGITFSRTNFHYYWNWFTKEDVGNDIELVELSFEKNNVEDSATCDGFVLTGGVDVHFSFYKGDETYANKPDEFQLDRDLFETKIYEYSQSHNLPLLAICRGMQLVNVLNGGRLHQDLESGNEVHRKTADVDKIHPVKIVAGSLLAEIAGVEEEEINSAHHQAVHCDDLGKNLKVTAFAKGDDVAEAMEFADKTGKAFMLCVQWHPERMKKAEAHPLSKNIKARFLAEVRNKK